MAASPTKKTVFYTWKFTENNVFRLQSPKYINKCVDKILKNILEMVVNNDVDLQLFAVIIFVAFSQQDSFDTELIDVHMMPPCSEYVTTYLCLPGVEVKSLTTLIHTTVH